MVALNMLVLALALSTPGGRALAPIPDLASAANNSLFAKWRPRFHFAAPNSWMNDPCAPYYDAPSATYHMFYQYHPQHVQWGNISWGHATSKDMVIWTDAPAANVQGATDKTPLALVPQTQGNDSYDKLGVFSGGAISDGKGGWAIIYTGVQALPTSWQIPYTPHTETVLLARTNDSGASWEQASARAAIPSPSDAWNVTGWRDPLPVLEAELLRAAVFAQDDWEGTAYVTMGSGLKGDADVAGRVLLYRTVDPGAEHLTKWEFAGPLFAAKANASWDADAGWSGNFGQNFEMSGLLALYPEHAGAAGSAPVWAAHIGVEGLFPAGQPRALVVLGAVESSGNKTAKLVPSAVAIGDWGATYAYNHFQAPAVDGQSQARRIISAWLPDAWNTNANFSGAAMGYNGALILPREVFLKTVEGVTSDSARVVQRASWTYANASDGSVSVRTLGVRPVRELSALRESASAHVVPAPAAISADQPVWLHASASSAYELQMRIAFAEPYAPAGLVVRASNTSQEHTIIAYDPRAEELSVVRANASALSFDPAAPAGSAAYVANYTEKGKLRLWDVHGAQQALNLTVFIDNSFIEIYANEVFVLSTRIYPWADDASNIWAWTNNTVTTFSDIQIWDGLANAWPERAQDTSVPLIYDGTDKPWDGR